MAKDTERVRSIFSFIEKLTVPSGTGAGNSFRLRKFQKDFIRDVYSPVDKDKKRIVRRAILSLGRKNGKGLALDTPIPTPDGWTIMGDIQEGDTLFDEQGKQCNVTFVSDLKFLDCYEVKFSNGEKIVCDGDHLWLTTARVNTVGNKGIGRTCPSMRTIVKRICKRGYLYLGGRYIGRNDDPGAHKIAEQIIASHIEKYPTGIDTYTNIRDTRELFETQKYSKRGDRNHCLNMSSPVICDKKDLPIHPYVLGVWLGDGTSASADISCGKEDLKEICDNLKFYGINIKVKKDRTCYQILLSLGREGKRADKIQTKLRALGLLHNKHIPNIYLRSSIQQRIDLLHGLMDTDGTCDKQGRAQEFCTVKKKLLDGFCELLSSLGVKYSVREKKLRCNGKDLKGVSYSVQFCCFRDILPVFKLSRKLLRQKILSNSNISPRSRTLQIISVEKVESVPTKCIQVDSVNSLFLCGKTFIPTHNTALIAALSLVHLVGPESITNGENFSLANDRDQAGIVFKYAAQMVRAEPELSDIIKIVDSTKTMVCFQNGSFYKAISSEVSTKFGLNPSWACFDELAQARNRDLYDAIDTAFAARSEPLFITISTQSNDPNHILSQLIDDGLSKRDPSTVCHLYAVPDDAEDIFENEKLWYLANPALNDFRSLEEMRTAAKRAQRMPSFEASFRNLYLNQRIDSKSPLIPRAEWMGCVGDATIIPGEEIYLGLDLSGKTDLTALQAISNGPLDKVKSWFWKPKDTLDEHENRDHVPYKLWEKQGFIKTTPGKSIQYSFIAQELAEISKTYTILGLAFDRYRIDDLRAAMDAIGLASYIEKRDKDGNPIIEPSGGIRLVPWGQGYKDMTPAIEAFEGSILNRTLVHNLEEPVLTWNISNAMAISDAAGNRKLDKSAVTFRIDGAVALCMAVGLKSRDNKGLDKKSSYIGLTVEEMTARMAL